MVAKCQLQNIWRYWVYTKLNYFLHKNIEQYVDYSSQTACLNVGFENYYILKSY